MRDAEIDNKKFVFWRLIHDFLRRNFFRHKVTIV